MDYTAKITQTLDELQQLEKQQTNVANRDYVRFIRLLKEKQANSQKQAAQLINLGLRQGQRIWAKYLSQGIDALIEVRTQAYIGKLSFTQISHLRQFLQDDQAHSLTDVQAYLADSHGVKYTIGGVSSICKRLKIKKKTGQPVHIHQTQGAVEDYKKKFADLAADFAPERILFQDELRAGTRTETGRKWSPMGHRPYTPVQIGCESLYLYLALCPFRG